MRVSEPEVLGPKQLARALAAFLGPPDDEAMLEADDREMLPSLELQALHQWGTSAFYVPRALGGRLERTDALLELVRVVAHRDMTLAIAHGKTILGVAPVWVAGNLEAQQRSAARVLRNEPIALALTERACGADLTRMETTAHAGGSGFVLRGEKWLINNARRATALTVLARTGEAGAPGGLTVFEVANDPLRGVHPTAKVKTMGVRGADIAGVIFQDARLEDAARIGPVGSGLDVILRSLQLTRALCAGLSLGCTDRALELTLRFASERHLYGGPLDRLPLVRSQLADAAMYLFVAAEVANTALRLAHECPERASVAAAVAKAWVPTGCQKALELCATVLGARHYVREGEYRVFEKVLRDHRLVGLFDGSTVVNLAGLGAQLVMLLPNELASPAASPACFGSGPLRPYDFQATRLIARNSDGVIARALASNSPFAESLAREVASLEAALSALKQGGEKPLSRSPKLFAIAERYCSLWALAVVLCSPSVEAALRERFSRLVLGQPPEEDTTDDLLNALRKSVAERAYAR